MDFPLPSTPFLCCDHRLDPRPTLLVINTVQKVPGVTPIAALTRSTTHIDVPSDLPLKYQCTYICNGHNSMKNSVTSPANERFYVVFLAF